MVGEQKRYGGMPACRTSRPRPSASSICSWRAARRRSICSITSPTLEKLHNTELPDSIRMGQRITGMTTGQKNFPCVKSIFKFAQHGKAGTWVSELLPHIAGIADDICRHQVGEHRGHQSRPGDHLHPNRLPATGPALHRLVAELRTRQREPEPARLHRHDFQRQGERPTALHAAVGSGFLPSEYQGVQFRGTGDPVLYLSNPAGIDAATPPPHARRARRS